MAKPDLNKLRTEIASRKNERTTTSAVVNGTVVNNVAPRDKFLYELIQSRDTGMQTSATKLIKLVENQVAVKNKETTLHNVSETVEKEPARMPIQPSNNNRVDMSPEREEQMFNDLQAKNKQTLAESIAPFVGGGKPQYPNNYPATGMAVPPQQLNEGYLVENVKKIVDNYLINNFGPVVEEAIKGTILEMYAAERIKEVLTENKEMIRGVIFEVIREISDKNKAKKAQL
jgi:hypothetical protein